MDQIDLFSKNLYKKKGMLEPYIILSSWGGRIRRLVPLQMGKNPLTRLFVKPWVVTRNASGQNPGD